VNALRWEGMGQQCFGKDACPHSLVHLSVMVGNATPHDVIKHTINQARTIVEHSGVWWNDVTLTVININDANQAVSC